jgi:hypothetical protein
MSLSGRRLADAVGIIVGVFVGAKLVGASVINRDVGDTVGDDKVDVDGGSVSSINSNVGDAVGDAVSPTVGNTDGLLVGSNVPSLDPIATV